MKTAFAIALGVLGVAQLFAGPQRAAPPHMAAPHLPAISHPQVQFHPRIARESRVAPERGAEAARKRDESARNRGLETAGASRSPVSPSAEKTWAERPPAEERRQQTQANRDQAQRRQQETTRPRLSFTEARERMPRERHDRAWWDQRYNRIVRAGTGYYFFDAGYWYPAFGYDPDLDTYVYDGPICANADLTPDEEIKTVQATLQADGYYNGSITGVLDTATLTAITEFQTANDLLATGAIDQPTLEALGLS